MIDDAPSLMRVMISVDDDVYDSPSGGWAGLQGQAVLQTAIEASGSFHVASIDSCDRPGEDGVCASCWTEWSGVLSSPFGELIRVLVSGGSLEREGVLRGAIESAGPFSTISATPHNGLAEIDACFVCGRGLI